MYKLVAVKFIVIMIGLVLLFHSCIEEKVNDLDESLFGYQYFPLEIGKYWIYQVDSTIIDDVGASTIKSSSFVKEEITESYINELGETEYRIERSKSETLNGDYLITDAWKAELNENFASRTEENLRFIKMVFPISIDIDWNGNHFDELTRIDVAGERIWVYKDWGNYQVDAKGVELTVNGEAYSNSVIITQADFESDIEKRFSKEYYAPEIGLIKKEMIIFDTQCICPGETWFEKAEAGYTLNQILVEHN